MDTKQPDLNIDLARMREAALHAQVQGYVFKSDGSQVRQVLDYLHERTLEIESQHARIAELEALAAGYDAARLENASLQAQLEAIGAGGVEPLRKRCLHKISEPAQPVAWAIFAEDGGACMWTQIRQHAEATAKDVGLQVTPLYAAQAAPVDAEPLWRTDAEIVEQTEILARYLLSWKWGLQPESPDAQLRNSQSTKAQKAWNAACDIQDLLTATDVENAVAEVDDAARAAQGGDK